MFCKLKSLSFLEYKQGLLLMKKNIKYPVKIYILKNYLDIKNKCMTCITGKRVKLSTTVIKIIFNVKITWYGITDS